MFCYPDLVTHSALAVRTRKSRNDTLPAIRRDMNIEILIIPASNERAVDREL